MFSNTLIAFNIRTKWKRTSAMGYELLAERINYTGIQSLRHHSLFLSPHQRSQLLLQSRLHPYGGMVPGAAAAAAAAVSSPNSAAAAFAAAAAIAAANYRSLMQPRSSRPVLALAAPPPGLPPPRSCQSGFRGFVFWCFPSPSLAAFQG